MLRGNPQAGYMLPSRCLIADCCKAFSALTPPTMAHAPQNHTCLSPTPHANPLTVAAAACQFFLSQFTLS